MGEVGLPGLIGLLGFESEVGTLRPLRRFWGHSPGTDQDAVDRGPRQHGVVGVLQVPGDGVGALSGEETRDGNAAPTSPINSA